MKSKVDLLGFNQIVKDFFESFKDLNKVKTSPLSTQATVTKVEGDIAWVHIGGGVPETPVKMTIDCKVGDVVQIQGNKAGKAWITGNQSHPPTDDTAANQAKQTAEKVMDMAKNKDFNGKDAPEIVSVEVWYCMSTSNSEFIKATGYDWQTTIPAYVAGLYYWTKTITTYDDDTTTETDPVFDLGNQAAAEANALAHSVNNHFWYDSTGAYVTKNTNDKTTGYATRVAAEGIEHLYNGKKLFSQTSSALTFWQSDGEKKMAVYGSSAVQLYADNKKRTQVDTDGLKIFDTDGITAILSVLSSGITFNSAYPMKIGSNNTYLEWTSQGHLNIVASDISIGSNAVATENDIPTNVSDLTNDSGYQTASDVSSAIASGITGKADKSASIASTVSLYYRSTTETTPTINSETTIGTSASTDNAWEYVMPQPKRDRYFYTCEKYTFVDGSISFSTVRALASETYASKWCSSSDNTYIDGGKIYANSVTADQINVSTLSLGESQIMNLTTDLASKANSSDVPTKVSQLTNDSSFATTTQVGTAKDQAISTAASDATTKANAAAKTASDYIGVDTNGIKIAKNVASATTYSWIDANGLQVYKNNVSVASFGSEARIGATTGPYTTVSSNGFQLFDPNRDNGDSEVCKLSYDSTNANTYIGRKYITTSEPYTYTYDEYIKFTDGHTFIGADYKRTGGTTVLTNSIYIDFDATENGMVAHNMFKSIYGFDITGSGGNYLRNGNNLLKRVTLTKSNISVPTSGFASDTISLTGDDYNNYEILGVIGWDISNATGGSGASRVYIGKLARSSATAVGYELGTASSNVKIDLVVYVLCYAKGA